MRPLYRVMFAIDIVAFGGQARNDDIRARLRTVLYEALETSFSISGLPFTDCYREDRGDGVFIVGPEYADPTRSLDPMLHHLSAVIRRHNSMSSEAARIRLRMAVHSGYIHTDPHGPTGQGVNHLFRLLEAESFRHAVATARPRIGLIVSDHVYDTTVGSGLSTLDPGSFRPVIDRVKETVVRGWMYLLAPEAPEAEPSPAALHPPDPLKARSVAEFGQLLAELRLWNGNPSYIKMARDIDHSYSPSTLSQVTRQARLPTLSLLTCYLRACGVDEEETEAWRFAWQRLASIYALQPLDTD